MELFAINLLSIWYSKYVIIIQFHLRQGGEARIRIPQAHNSRFAFTFDREVKLADVLSKPIIPVSYLTYWPPRSLAIQFATTQFIYWRPLADVKLDSGNDVTVDISLWSPNDVSAVATRIANR